jgi:hypothetical protein
MTDKQDPIAHAARLLREAAEELRQAHAYNNSEGWENETDAKAAYDDHLAAAQALEDWEQAVGAGGVQPLRKCLHHIEEPLEKVLERREAVIQILERDAHEAHQRAAHALGTRKVLWNLLGECSPLLHQLECNDHESEEQLNSLLRRIDDARAVVQAEELPNARP